MSEYRDRSRREFLIGSAMIVGGVVMAAVETVDLAQGLAELSDPPEDKLALEKGRDRIFRALTFLTGGVGAAGFGFLLIFSRPTSRL